MMCDQTEMTEEECRMLKLFSKTSILPVFCVRMSGLRFRGKFALDQLNMYSTRIAVGLKLTLVINLTGMTKVIDATNEHTHTIF